jgi:hypothetical protein
MRQVKVREDYSHDLATLNTIATAVKRDERISKEERESVVSDIHRVIKKLMAIELASLDPDEQRVEAEGDADVPPVTVETPPESVIDGDTEG